MTTDDTLKIRELNDRFRRTLGTSGKRLMTAGVAALPFADQAAIVGKVMNFEDFTEDNDPHGEHDFGAFDFKDERIFWKIDYYNRKSFGSGFEMGADYPEDATKTTRVLTIMLADEY